MAYGSAKGRIFRGDIYAEDDPNQDTYIDWGNDFISFGVGGIKVLNVSASDTIVQVLGQISASSNITASGHVSASAFYGDGRYLVGLSSAGSNQQIQFNDGGAFGADSSLQWAATPKLLIVTGTVSASSTLISKYVTASTHVSATTFYGDGQYLKGIVTASAGGTNGLVQFNQAGAFAGAGDLKYDPSGRFDIGSSGFITACTGALHVTGAGMMGFGSLFSVGNSNSTSGSFLMVSGSGLVHMSGAVTISGSLSSSANVTASGHVSASAFYGDGQYLKNVGGGSGGGIFTTLGTGNAYTTSSLRVGAAGEPAAILHVDPTSSTTGSTFFQISDPSPSTPVNANPLTTAQMAGILLKVTGSGFIFGEQNTFFDYGQVQIGAQDSGYGRLELGTGSVNDGTAKLHRLIHNNSNQAFEIWHGDTTANNKIFTLTSASVGNSTLHMSGNISASSNITASGHVSASFFYGDGQYLKNVGGGGTPGGSNTEVQFNDAGAFSGSSRLTYNKTTDTLSILSASAKSYLATGTLAGVWVSASSPGFAGGNFYGEVRIGSGTFGSEGWSGAGMNLTDFGTPQFTVQGGAAELILSASSGIYMTNNLQSSANITASGHVSASAFYGDGQYLKNLPTGALNTTTGGGNTTLFIPFVSSSTGASPAQLFTDSALALKPQSGSLTLSGDGKTGVSGSLLGFFTTTSSYGSRLSFKGANVGASAGTEPYVHVVSSSYIVPADAFGPGFPPSDLALDYETLEIRAPGGVADGGDVRITGSGNFHLDFSRASGSSAWPFTRTFQSTMAFGSLETAVYLTSTLGGEIITSPWSIINGNDDDGAMYAAIDYESGGWYFSSGSNPKVQKFSSDLTGSWSNNFNFQSPGSASFFGGLIVHSVPLTSNVGAQIGGGAANRLQVIVTSSFENVAAFGRAATFNDEAYFNGNVTSNNNQLLISGSSGGGMTVNITSSDPGGHNSLFTQGGVHVGSTGGGNADIRLFAGGSPAAGNISGSANLEMAGNATIAGDTTIGRGGNNFTMNVSSVNANSADIAWLVRSGSVGTGSGPGKNGPLMFYMSGAGGTTDLLKFNTASGSVGVVFPRTFYPNSSNNVDMGTNDLAFRTVFATKIGSAGNFTVDGVNASNSNFAIDMPNNVTEALMIRDTTAGSNWITLGTSTGAERVTISKPTYIGGSEAASPAITLDVHYTGSKSPVNLANNTGGGEVVYFGTGSLTNVGGVHYLNKKGGWVPTNADATGSGLTGDGGHQQLLGIALGNSPSADGMLIRGFFNATGAVGTYLGSFKSGSAVYLQAQSAPGQGYMSGTAPSGSGRFVRVVGYATDTAHVIYFNPDSTYIELA